MSKLKAVAGIDPSLSATCMTLLGLDGETIDQTILGGESLPKGCRDPRVAKRLGVLRSLAKCRLEIWARRYDLLVVLEGYSFGSSKSREALAEWGGVLRLLLQDLGIPYLEVSPGQIKKWALGVGKGSKLQVALAAQKRWGVSFDTDDQFDSYVAARIGLGLIDPTGLRVTDLEVLKEVKKKMGWRDVK